MSENERDLIEPDDADSALGELSQEKSTTSLTSSIYNHRYIHGRSYQASKTTEYWAPNDEVHLKAMDLAHYWLTMMLQGKLFAAPIPDDVQKVLDVGTGTGIWALDFADEYPSAEVIGIDIAPTQPSWVPSNLHFEIEDAQLDWTFETDFFDFIHIRYMHGSFDDWNKLYRQLYKFLKPGGWFQHIEPDIEAYSEDPRLEIGPDHVFKRWADAFYQAGHKVGRTFKVTEQMENWPKDAGFADIEHKIHKVPLNHWPKDKNLKEQGILCGAYMDDSLDGFVTLPLGETLGWERAKVELLVAEFRKAIRNPKNRPVAHMHCVYGQKPKTQE